MPRRVLILLGLATVAMSAVMLAIDPAREAAGNPSILDLEFAWDEAGVEELLADWGEEGEDAARLSLWVDYAYMLIYGAFLTAVAISVRRGAAARGSRRLAAAGAVAVPAAFAAPACDAVENAWLLIALGGAGGDLAPMLGALFAAAKFAALAVAIAYGLWGGVAALRARSAAPA